MFGTNRYTLSLTALSHDHQGLVSITGVHLLPAILTAKLAVSLKQPGHEPNTPLHHWHHLPCSRLLDKIQPNLIHCLLPKTNTGKKRQIICFICGFVYDQQCMGVICGGSTLLFDLSDLSHGLLQDGTFVRLDVEAVDV